MIPQAFLPFKIDVTSDEMTAHSGLALVEFRGFRGHDTGSWGDHLVKGQEHLSPFSSGFSESPTRLGLRWSAGGGDDSFSR